MDWVLAHWEVVSATTGAGFGGIAWFWRKILAPRWRATKQHYNGIVETISRVDTDLRELKSKVLPNGGSSVADALARLEALAKYQHAVTMALTDLQGVAFWHSDQHGLCVLASDELKHIVGNSVLGNEWLSGLHPDDFDEVRKAWTSAITERRQFRHHYRFVHPDGQTFYVEGIGRALPHFEVGAFPGFVGCLQELKFEEWQRRKDARTGRRKRGETDE